MSTDLLNRMELMLERPRERSDDRRASVDSYEEYEERVPHHMTFNVSMLSLKWWSASGLTEVRLSLVVSQNICYIYTYK